MSFKDFLSAGKHRLPQNEEEAKEYIKNYGIKALVDNYIEVYYANKSAFEFVTVSEDSFESFYGNNIYAQAETYLLQKLVERYPIINKVESYMKFKDTLEKYTKEHLALGENEKINRSEIARKAHLPVSTVSEIYSKNSDKIHTFDSIVAICLSLGFDLKEVNDLLYLLGHPVFKPSKSRRRDKRKEILQLAFEKHKDFLTVDNELYEKGLVCLSKE